MEPKKFGLKSEKFFSKQGIWFFAVVSLILSVIIWLATKQGGYMPFAAAMGSSIFFIVYGFKQQAEQAGHELRSNKIAISDLSKLFYLEILDSTFSIDGVIGAFAFTLSVPLVILGNGLGAFVVRELTIKGSESIKKYIYLKNGAMYSIFVLGVTMLLKSFGVATPDYVSLLATMVVVGYFFIRSVQEKNRNKLA